jgi:hypothetical protein
MARLARVVIPDLPHHVTQRGNGGARTFFGDDDYALYRDLLAASCRAAEVEGVVPDAEPRPSWSRRAPTDCGVLLMAPSGAAGDFHIM